MATVYLGLGANMGDRKKNLTEAIRMLSQQLKVEEISSIYETEPEGFTQQPLFLNAVCRISTELNPEDLLDLIKKIEYEIGRRPSFTDAPRPIDIDILLYNDKIIQSQSLTIPHPQLAQRAFVLVPLAEIAPGAIHPGNGSSISQLLKNLDSTDGVNKWDSAEGLNQRRHYV